MTLPTSYPFTTDKRAWTYQRCSINLNFLSNDKRESAAFVKKLMISFPLSNLDDPDCQLVIGNIRFSQTGLNTGTLWGNSFSIRLRQFGLIGGDGIHSSDSRSLLQELLHKRIQKIKECGFPNYFGTQRTGLLKQESSNLLSYLATTDMSNFESQILEFLSSSSMPQGPQVGRLCLNDKFEEAVQLLIGGSFDYSAKKVRPFF